MSAAAADRDRDLAALWERGQAAWPQLTLPEAEFLRHVATHLPAGEVPEGSFSSLHADGLFLACACARGDAAALAAFDATILSQVPAWLSRMDPSPSYADELRQVLREKLLVAPAGDAPKIAEYAGQGALASWVRVVAVRTAVSLRRRRDEKPGEALEESDGDLLPLGQDPELDYLRARYQKEFKEALQAAFALLSKEQRHVLRFHFSGGLTGDAIAALLQVNRRTVVRWLAGARTAMLKETRRLLQERLHLAPAELDSLIGLVRSRFDVSITALLKKSQS